MTEADLAERVWTMPVLGAAEQRARDKMLSDVVSHRISSLLRRSATLSDAEKDDLAELMMRHVFSRTTKVPKATLTMGWEWVDGPVGITEAETARREKQGKSDTAFRAKLPGGQPKEVEVTMFGRTIKVQEIEAIDLPRYMQSLPTAGSPRCYASSHVEEYFAQVTCCWFGAAWCSRAIGNTWSRPLRS